MKLQNIHIISRSLLFLLVIQTLNLSINSIDFFNTPSKGMTNVDDLDYVDSMVEFMFEDVLGFSKHTFDDHAINGNIAKLQQNIVHLDLRSIQYPQLLSDLKAKYLKNSRIKTLNESAICLCYKEVLPKPPQF